MENGQYTHFQQLDAVLRELGHGSDFLCSGSGGSLSWEPHVKFGLVEGMSTRRGDVVLLADVLDEATDRIRESMDEKNS